MQKLGHTCNSPGGHRKKLWSEDQRRRLLRNASVSLKHCVSYGEGRSGLGDRGGGVTQTPKEGGFSRLSSEGQGAFSLGKS